MVDFTGVPNPVLQAAYKRGKDESAQEIAELNRQREVVLMALVDVLYDDEKRKLIAEKLEEAYDLVRRNAIVIDL